MSKNKRKKSEPEVTQNPVRDLAGFLLLSFGVFVGIALISYHPVDPSWNTAVSSKDTFIHNYGGLIGSYSADLLMQLFGYASYAVPIAIFLLTAVVVFRPTWKGTWQRGVGFILLVVATSLFFALISSDTAQMTPWGGLTGYLLKGLLTKFVGTIGAYLFGLTAFAIALVLTVGVTFTGFIHFAARTLHLPAIGVGLAAQGLAQAKSWLGRFLELGEREIKAGMKEIRKDAEPKLPPSKITIAGKEVASKPEELLDPVTSVEAIPIVIPKKRPTSRMPSFHSLPRTEEKEKEVKAKRIRAYKLPNVDLLDAPEDQELSIDRNELFQNAQTLEQKLKDFGVFGKVVEVQPGPVVTMYEFEPAPGVKVQQLTRLNDDLALALKALSVRIEPIPGKAVIGIEVANRNRQVVYLKDNLADDAFDASQSNLTLALGKDISGTPIMTDLRKMPHLLVAGATGSGKSVAVNSMILSILYKSTPDEVRMILVDPKMLELSLYDGIPHLLLPVVTDPRKSAAALRWAVIEMERRYRLMADIGVRNIEGYNRKIPKVMEDIASGKMHEIDESAMLFDNTGQPQAKKDTEEHTGKMPFIVIVIDELADLMMVSSREVEESIIRLAQMARAAGIHLLLATQRPSVDVITGVIKANMPARISFQVSSKIDSRTILDANGAELLLGAGDMLFLPPGTSKLKRIHGAFVTDNEVKKVTDFWKEQGDPDYNHEILKVQEEQAQLAAEGGGEDEDMYRQALNVVRAQRVASISMIQRKLRIGYNRAARLVERMEDEGLLAPGEVGKPREVIASRIDSLVG